MMVFLFSDFSTLYSQQKALYFNSYTTENGLSQNSINSIVQDQHGFIWIATESGLNQFDGYKFKKWFQDPGNKNSLISAYINQLAVDKSNHIWMATTAGISYYNSKTNKFSSNKYNKDEKVSLSHNLVNCIFVDSDNYLWVGTKKGLNRTSESLNKFKYDDSGLSFSKFFREKSSKSVCDNEISYITEDKEGNIWIGTKNGLNRFIKKSGTFNTYFFSQYAPGQNGANEINSVIQVNDSIMWVATEAGLFSLNTKSNYSFSFSKRKFFKKNKISGSIRSLLLDSKGNIWIGTFGNGLLFYDSSENQFYQYKKEEKNKNNLNDNFIISLFEDQSGTLFIGTYGKGLNTAKISGNNFELFRHTENDNTSLSESFVLNVYCQDKYTIWFGTISRGLEKFNPEIKKFIHYPFNNLKKNKAGVSVLSVIPINHDELWIGTRSAGLLLFNHKTNTYKQYLHHKNKNSISNNHIFYLNNEQDSVLWIGTFGSGLDKLNIETGIFKHYNVDPGDSTKLSHGILLSLKFDKMGQLWIASWGGGLMKFNPKTEEIKHFKHSLENRYSISSDFVTTIHFDKKGILWIGTSSGLNKYDPKTHQFIYFGKKNGFADEFINSIEEDQHENLWLSTNRGMIKFNKQTQEVTNYDIKDGLQDNEFTSGCNTKLPDGRMIFGGNNGFNLFHPDSIKQSAFKPNLVITEFQLFYKIVEIGVKYENNFQLNKLITDVDTIILNYKNNVIGFEFTTLDYSKPDNIKYAFRLNGFEEDWNYTDKNERFARYTNLGYGNYVLQIKSTNGDGVWNPKIKELTVIIKAPFWLTYEFRIAFLIIVLLFFIFIYRLRTRILKKQKRNLEKQVDERTQEIKHKNFQLKDRYEEIVVQEEEIREQAEELRMISAKLEKSNKSLSQKVKERTVELENALIKAEDAQKLISSFLSNLSHEIRTPMNAIMGFTQLIGVTELSESKKHEYTGIIEKNVHSLLVQIDNIMDVARLHTGQYNLKNSVFSLNELFSKVHHELASTKEITNKNFSLKLLLNSELILNSDQSVLKNIILNLVENAIKYTEEGFVEFGFKVNGPTYNEVENFKIALNSSVELEIFVNDSGIGIAENEQKTIFDAFRKIEDKKQKLYRGAGLGLALVRSLTEKLNGSIFVNSKIDEGTRILIKIPISEI